MYRLLQQYEDKSRLKKVNDAYETALQEYFLRTEPLGTSSFTSTKPRIHYRGSDDNDACTRDENDTIMFMHRQNYWVFSEDTPARLFIEDRVTPVAMVATEGEGSASTDAAKALLCHTKPSSTVSHWSWLDASQDYWSLTTSLLTAMPPVSGLYCYVHNCKLVIY